MISRSSWVFWCYGLVGVLFLNINLFYWSRDLVRQYYCHIFYYVMILCTFIYGNKGDISTLSQFIVRIVILNFGIMGRCMDHIVQACMGSLLLFILYVCLVDYSHIPQFCMINCTQYMYDNSIPIGYIDLHDWVFKKYLLS